VFEGPLDLLLYLVRRDGIDLKKLRVAEIADSYLSFLDQMRELDLAIASEYLVLASQLVHLKSLDLLPRLPTLPEPTEEDPRDALMRRLAEYATYREVAEHLQKRPRVGRDVFTRTPVVFEEQDPGTRTDVDTFALFEIFFELMQREAPAVPVVAFSEPPPDIRTCTQRLLLALGEVGERIGLVAWLQSLDGRGEKIATFIGLLEMMRRGWLDGIQADDGREVWIWLEVPVDQVVSEWLDGTVEPAGAGT
jgi:segregation and condensation protein A